MKLYGTIFQIYHNYYLKSVTHFGVCATPWKKDSKSEFLGCLPFQKKCPEKQESAEVLLSKLFGYAESENVGGFKLFIRKNDNMIANQRCLGVRGDLYKFCDVIRIIKWKMTETQIEISLKILGEPLGPYISALVDFFRNWINSSDRIWMAKIYVEK